MKMKTLIYTTAAVTFLVLLVALWERSPSPKDYIYQESTWDAASISGKPANDFWVQYNAADKRVVAEIYRDYDGDGLVDEAIQ
jgi:hypothetical protein